MKKIYLLSSIMLLLGFYSCSLKPDAPNPGDIEVTINAGIASTSDQTKASYSDLSAYMIWESGDNFGLYELGNSNNENVLFSMIPGSLASDSRSASFSGVLNNPGDSPYLAYYPHNTETSFASQGGEYLIGITFPWNQTYVDGGFSGLPAYAFHNGELNDPLVFKTFCNILEIRVVLPEGSPDRLLSKIEIIFDDVKSESSILESGKSHISVVNGVINDMGTGLDANVTHTISYTIPSPFVSLPKKSSGTDITTCKSFFVGIPSFPYNGMATGSIVFTMSDDQTHTQYANLEVLLDHNLIYVTPILKLENIGQPAGSNIVVISYDYESYANNVVWQ